MNYVLFIIAIALVFDFINGMHDSANSIATVVSTRVLIALHGRLLGRVLQLRRGVPVRHGRGEDDRLGPDRHHRRQLGRRPRRAARRDHLEPHHLVFRTAVLLLPCAHRRLRGRGRRAGRRAGDRAGDGVDQDARVHRALAAHRDGRGLGPDDRRCPGCSTRRRTARSTAGSAGRSWGPRRPSPFPMGPTTRRRRWESSADCSSQTSITLSIPLRGSTGCICRI